MHEYRKKEKKRKNMIKSDFNRKKLSENRKGRNDRRSRAAVDAFGGGAKVVKMGIGSSRAIVQRRSIRGTIT